MPLKALYMSLTKQMLNIKKIMHKNRTNKNFNLPKSNETSNQVKNSLYAHYYRSHDYHTCTGGACRKWIFCIIDNHDSGYLGMAVQLYVQAHLGHYHILTQKEYNLNF